MDCEQSLLDERCCFVAGMDEVGRGSVAGPVAVGVVVVDSTTPAPDQRVADSKLVRPVVREALVPVIREWAVDVAVGMASSTEIDAYGIVEGLRRAGIRALASLRQAPDVVLLDGVHNWLSTNVDDADGVLATDVQMIPGGDRTCASIAAASILAKVERDDLMAKLGETYPAYEWASNKGYGSQRHRDAIRIHGVSPLHRLSFLTKVKG